MNWKEKRLLLHKKAAAISYQYSRFMETQGFYIVLFVCVLTIVLTAVFTNKNNTIIQPPPAFEGLFAAAEDSGVERLKDVSTPAPTAAPPVFTYPLEKQSAVYRAFDGARPAFFESSGHWQLHRGIDIAAVYGQTVLAVADGTVESVLKGGAGGITVTLHHAGGYESRYKGLLSAAGTKEGDPVKMGRPIGNAGYGPLIESEEGAHIHLEILKDGIFINPSDLF